MKNGTFITSKRTLTVIIALLLVVAGGATYYFVYLKTPAEDIPNTSYTPHAQSAGQNTKGQTPTVVNNPTPTTSSKGVGAETGGTGSSTPASNNTLLTPSGVFVNTHQPSSQSQMFSTCDTSVGATCQISFTNTSTNKVISLNVQTVDSSGAAYWSWTPQQIGLAKGAWKVTATAALNGQSKTATDASNLEIQ